MTRLLLFISFFAWAGPAAAQCDENAPALIDLSFSPAVVDVSAGDQNVTVTVQVTDDLSGVERVGLEFRSPSGVQNADCTSSTPVSGSTTAGSFECTATVREFSEAGGWLAGSLSLTDFVGRSTSLNTAEIISAGFPVGLQVISVQDVDAPLLTGLTLTPTAIDVSTGNAQVGCTIDVTDNLAGVGAVECLLSSPVEQRTLPCIQLVPGSGSPTAGSYDCTIDVPRYVENGSWQVQVGLSDVVGNRVEWSSAELALAGLPDSVAVTSAPVDLTPPVLVDFDMQPLTVNVEDAARTVTCSAELTDDLAGVSFFGCTGTYLGPGFEILTEACVDLDPDSGDRNDGTWSCDLVIPQYSPDGTRGIVTALAVDLVSNSTAADSSLLQAAGFPSSFDVVCGEPGTDAGPQLAFIDTSILNWPPLLSAIEYNVYGGSLSFLVDADANGLPDAGYGLCRNAEDSNTTDTIFIDASDPPPGTAEFFLVGYDTPADQDLGLGTTSGGLARVLFSPCP